MLEFGDEFHYPPVYYLKTDYNELHLCSIIHRPAAMPTILFLHANFPAQFRHLAAYLAAKGCKVIFLSAEKGKGWNIQGVVQVSYRPDRLITASPSPLSTAEAHAKGAAKACLTLLRRGIQPDVIYAASGWGGNLVSA